MASTPTLTPARRAVATALLFLGSAFLAGVSPGPAGVTYRTFGITEGILALLFTYIFTLRRAWIRTPGPLGWLAVGYGTIASAQLLDLLLPPPGVVEWLVVTGLALSAWAALAGRSRKRLMASLASLALLLALLKFSVIPFVWERAGPAAGEAWGLGNLAESVRRLFVDYEPVEPVGQLVGFAAIACWTIATRLLWEDGSETARPREQGVQLVQTDPSSAGDGL